MLRRSGSGASLFVPRSPLTHLQLSSFSTIPPSPEQNQLSLGTVVKDAVAHTLPAIPKKVELHDVLSELNNGQLTLSSAGTVAKIKNSLREANDGKYSKHELRNLGINTNYSVIKIGDKFYNVYHGEKRNKLCGKGSTANLKFAQDMDTGEWILAKIQFTSDQVTPEICRERTRVEYDILRQLNVALGTFERYSPSKGFQTVTLIKFAHGMTLQHYFRFLQHFQRSLSTHQALDITIQFLDALDQLHNTHKIMHQDLKNENIVYDYAKKVLNLIDFGYSRSLAAMDDYGTQYDFIKASYILKGLWKNVVVNTADLQTDNRFLQTARDYIKGQMLNPTFPQSSPFSRAKVFFAEVRANMPPNLYMYGLVNPRDYLKETDRQDILSRLKLYDLVSIQDDKPTKGSFPVHHYLSLKRELENRGLLVSNTVYLNSFGTFATKTPQIAAIDTIQYRKEF